MRAVVLRKPFHAAIEDVPVPQPGEGEVLIKVAACGICGTDLAAYRGVHPRTKPPTIIGHETSGIVSRVGPGVTRLRVGDRVCVEPNLCCGKCVYCRQGLPNICPDYTIIGDHFDGAAAEYVKVPAANCYLLPDGLSLLHAALVQPLAISYHAVQRAGVQAGEDVLIIGAGQIGLGAMLFAKARGARVFITDVKPFRLELARRLGADFVMNALSDDVDALVRNATEGRGVHRAIEAVGGKQDGTVRQALALVQPRGTVTVLGSFGQDVSIPINDLKYREVELRGSQGHPQTFAPVIESLAKGTIDPSVMITHVIPLEQVPEALDWLDKDEREALKIVITPNGPIGELAPS